MSSFKEFVWQISNGEYFTLCREPLLRKRRVIHVMAEPICLARRKIRVLTLKTSWADPRGSTRTIARVYVQASLVKAKWIWAICGWKERTKGYDKQFQHFSCLHLWTNTQYSVLYAKLAYTHAIKGFRVFDSLCDTHINILDFNCVKNKNKW